MRLYASSFSWRSVRSEEGGQHLDHETGSVLDALVGRLRAARRHHIRVVDDAAEVERWGQGQITFDSDPNYRADSS